MRKIKTTNRDVLSMHSTLTNTAHLEGVKFVYARMKNIDVIEPIIKKWQELSTDHGISDENKEYFSKKFDLMKEHVSFNNHGLPMMSDDDYVFRSENDEKKFKDALINLKAEYPTAEGEQKAQINRLKEFQEKEVTVQMHVIKSNDIPANINSNEFNHLKFMIEE